MEENIIIELEDINDGSNPDDNLIYYIYGLYDPRTNELKYIGQAKNIQNRLKRHKKDARKYKDKYQKDAWILELRELKLQPIIREIEQTTKIKANERETYWIKYFKESNYKIFNVTDGGIGCKINGQIYNKGIPMSEEQKAKISKTLQGRIVSEETLIKQSKARKGVKQGKNTSSKYVGVSWDKKKNRWRVGLSHEGINRYGGLFKNEDDAGRAYNKLALKLLGPDARLNIIESDEVKNENVD
jgi:predicted GIY-YIG superfamily endonuclease